MSFLGGRLAGKEAAYFFDESKYAVARLAERIHIPTTTTTTAPPHSVSSSTVETADILPEVLRHSLPPKIFRQDHLSDSSSSLSTASKWTIRSPPNSNTYFSSVSPDALNPLRGYVSLPQVTFGRKRWQLPSAESSVIASTANDLRRDQYTQVNPEKLRAAAEVGKAFAVATAIIFGGAALTFGLVASKLELHNYPQAKKHGSANLMPFPVPETFTGRETAGIAKKGGENVPGTSGNGNRVGNAREASRKRHGSLEKRRRDARVFLRVMISGQREGI